MKTQLPAARRGPTAPPGASHQLGAMTPPEELLTAREREILALIGQGLSNKEIARALRISAATVKTHLHHVYAKLHQSGRYKAFLARSAEGAQGTPVGISAVASAGAYAGTSVGTSAE